MSQLTLESVLRDYLPTATPKFIANLEDAIRLFFGEKIGYNLQWRTKLMEAVAPEDKDKPRDQQRILFRFEVRAGDFLSPDIQITDVQVRFQQKEDKKA